MNKHVKCKNLWLVLSLTVCFSVPTFAADCEGKCVLAIGNSITFHGPDNKIGWNGNWGMAATVIEKDYVGQLLVLLTDKTKGDVWTANRQSGYLLEKDPAKFNLSDALIRQSKRANMVVVELGDNYTFSASTVDDFSRKYLEMLKAVRPLSGALACVSTFWTSKEKNKIIEYSCRQAGGTYVDISGLADQPENIAASQQTLSNKGVAAHPGDIGMKAIAERIFKAMQR